jgi:PAS domain S-box-containing protein
MNAKILLVDDDERNLATLEAILGTNGYELHNASNGPDACRLAESITPDLILLDVMMPGMDGFAVCRHIRTTPGIQSVPIIMLTALNDQASRLEGIRAGADDFLSKPCVFEEMRARVATVIRLNRFRIIAEQRTRFEQLFTLAPAATLLLDTAGRIVSANTKAAALFNYPTSSELAGRVLTAACPRDAAEKISSLLHDSGTPPGPVILRLSFSGAERVYSAQASHLDESNERLVLLILSDVTAEVRAREEAESMSRRLEEQVQARTQQLKDANDLLLSYASFISHDLRSPLCAVQGYLSFLQNDKIPVDADTLRQCVTGAHSAAQMMGDMIRSLLQLATDEKNQDAPPPEPFDPRPLVARLADKIANFNPSSKPAILVGPLPLVCARPALVERVFFNLLVNATKFSAARARPVIEVGSVATHDGTALYVRDNGVGFNQQDTARLFSAFSRLPGAEESDGLGLGLSLVSKLLSTHQGRIWAEGRPGEGATFFVQFKSPPTHPELAVAS